jgi:predicted nucleic acid-binding Zn ribbon protein
MMTLGSAGSTGPRTWKPSPNPEESHMAEYEGYCVKCREKRKFDGEVKEMANGRRAAQGTCPQCGTKMNRMLGKADK